MNTSRPRFGPAFALSLALLGLATVGFVSARNGAGTILCAMCLVGLIAGGIVGVPGRVLLLVAFGFMVAIWLTQVDHSANSRETSALAHAIGGSLIGWALVEALRHRIRNWLSLGLVVLSTVVVLTVVWELGEWIGDRLFDTALIPRLSDSAEDILFGVVGGMVGMAFAIVVAFLQRSREVRRGPADS